VVLRDHSSSCLKNGLDGNQGRHWVLRSELVWIFIAVPKGTKKERGEERERDMGWGNAR
jgi:hypothetical protein